MEDMELSECMNALASGRLGRAVVASLWAKKWNEDAD